MWKMIKEFNSAEKYANLINNNINKIKELLCSTETYATAEDEIYRSIKYLHTFIHNQKSIYRRKSHK